MKKVKYILVVNDWPIEGCQKIRSFDSYEEASKAGLSFVADHSAFESKTYIVKGEILSLIMPKGNPAGEK